MYTQLNEHKSPNDGVRGSRLASMAAGYHGRNLARRRAIGVDSDHTNIRDFAAWSASH
jgi:hypothetical protein